MSADEPALVFEGAATDFVTLASRLWDPLGRILVQHAAPRRGERVLDACCGAGASALPAARAVGSAGRVDAVDLTGPLVEHGRRAARDWPHLRFTRADVMAWQPLADGPYDLVQSGFGVFFLPDMDAGGKHLVSLLRPGGRFAVQCWRQGALAAFARCLFEATAEETGRSPAPPASAEASDRISSPAKLTEWLSSLGLIGVRVAEVPFLLPLDYELAWLLVTGTAFRALLPGSDESAARRIRDRLLDRISELNLTEVDAGSLIGTGTRV
jgi:ubiquinone/menaquinone biosynthesis C-methylase UbiE